MYFPKKPKPKQKNFVPEIRQLCYWGRVPKLALLRSPGICRDVALGLGLSGSGCRCYSHLCRGRGLCRSTSTGFQCTNQVIDLWSLKGKKTLPRHVIVYPSDYFLGKKGLSGGFTLEEITRNSGDAKHVVENRRDIFFSDYRSKTCVLKILKWYSYTFPSNVSWMESLGSVETNSILVASYFGCQLQLRFSE